MTNTENQKRRKKITAVVAMVLILCLLGGTFAWNDYRQHKTNEADLSGLFYKATLVEEYDRTKAKDWRTVDSKLTKKISVLNPGNTEAEDDREYGNIYARIQLKEFMEFSPMVQQYTTERYMIGTDGQFICFYPGVDYEITVGENGWPVARAVTAEDPGSTEPANPADATAPTAPGANIFAGGEAAAKEYARLISIKADNGDHEVVKQRIFFTPFKSLAVAENTDSINEWLARYNNVNGTSITLADITVDGAGESLDLNSRYLPPDIVDPENGLDDAELPWYIKTKESDPNGVYGNFMTIDGQIDETHSRNMLIDEDNDGIADFLNEKIPERADEDQKKAPDGLHDEWIDSAVDVGYKLPQVNGECEYTPHRWTDGLKKWKVNGPDSPSYFDYISWLFGEDVILLSEWDGKPCDKWIADDSETNTEGWVYWGNYIAPGQQTSNLLEALTLVLPSTDRAYYALHADMQAVSYDELYRWSKEKDPSGNDNIYEALIQAPLTISTIVINESPVEIGLGTTYSFSTTIQGSKGVNKDVVWSLQGYNGASSFIDKTGKLTVGADETAAKLVVRATSVRDDNKHAEWTVNLVDKPIVSTLTISPTTATLPVTDTVEFTAAETFVKGEDKTAGVEWSLENVPGSKIDVKKGNVTITPDGTDPLKAAVTVSNDEQANAGQTFKVVVTAKDWDKNNQYKTAEAVVTLSDNSSSSEGNEEFTDENGVEWIVLAKENGHKLIMTKYVYGKMTRYDNSEGWVNLEQSALKTALNDFYQNTAGADVKSAAVKYSPYPLTDVRSAPGHWDVNENAPAGYSHPQANTAAAADGSDSVFILSLSEANQCFDSAEERVAYDVDSPTDFSYWWLRSPGGSPSVSTDMEADPVACVGSGGHFTTFKATSYSMGYRPALWIKSAA